jgi:hypothetical protein
LEFQSLDLSTIEPTGCEFRPVIDGDDHLAARLDGGRVPLERSARGVERKEECAARPERRVEIAGGCGCQAVFQVFHAEVVIGRANRLRLGSGRNGPSVADSVRRTLADYPRRHGLNREGDMETLARDPL